MSADTPRVSQLQQDNTLAVSHNISDGRVAAENEFDARHTYMRSERRNLDRHCAVRIILDAVTTVSCNHTSLRLSLEAQPLARVCSRTSHACINRVGYMQHGKSFAYSRCPPPFWGIVAYHDSRDLKGPPAKSTNVCETKNDMSWRICIQSRMRTRQVAVKRLGVCRYQENPVRYSS